MDCLQEEPRDPLKVTGLLRLRGTDLPPAVRQVATGRTPRKNLTAIAKLDTWNITEFVPQTFMAALRLRSGRIGDEDQPRRSGPCQGSSIGTVA